MSALRLKSCESLLALFLLFFSSLACAYTCSTRLGGPEAVKLAAISVAISARMQGGRCARLGARDMKIYGRLLPWEGKRLSTCDLRFRHNVFLHDRRHLHFQGFVS